MKLSKMSWLLITIGALVIISATLGIITFQRVSEKNELCEKLDLALSNLQSNLQVQQLEGLSLRQEELEVQLDQATSQFEVVKAMLSQPVGNVAASSILFDVAQAHDLEVTEVTLPGPSSESLEGISCSVISLSARVEGDIMDLVRFMIELNTYLTTGVINSVVITIPETTSEEKASADIQLLVYTYQGD